MEIALDLPGYRCPPGPSPETRPAPRARADVLEELATSGEPCAISNFVIDEALTLLGRRASYEFAARVGRILYSSRAVEILRPSVDDETKALQWFEKYADQKVSFTDCISFVLMEARRIERVFGFDQDFVRAGFKLVPSV